MNEVSVKRSGAIGTILIYLLFGLFFIFQAQGSYSGDQLSLYVVLLGAYFWIAGLLVVAKVRHDLYIFEPIFFIAILYLCIYVYKPLIDLKTDSFYEHGVYVRDGGIKATLLIVLSFTVFYISYYSVHPRLVFGNRSHLYSDADEVEEESKPVSPQTIIFLYAAWGVAFALSIIAMLTQGLNLRYIFSLGNSGVRVNDGNTALLFLSNFAITSISLWLLIVLHSKNLLGKIIVSTLEILYLLTRNGRWLILVIALAPVVYYYVKRKRSPRIGFVVVGGLILLTVFAWMQANRYGIRIGSGYSGWGSQGFSLQVLTSPFESDFNTYRLFYSMVMRYPTLYPYMLGTTFAYIFILFIPRAFWAAKPNNPVLDIIEHSLNSNARQAGTAISNVGEIYANFGIIGCVIGMYILGWVASRVKELCYSEDENTLAMYAIIYPLLFQWTARGMFSSNVFTTIFAILPFFIVRRKTNKRYAS